MKLVPLLLLLPISIFAQSNSPPPNVRAWGVSDFGTTNVPPDLTNAVAVVGPGEYTLALRGNGTVVAWGTGAPTPPADLTNAVAISAGPFGRAMAITANGTIVAWGSGADELPAGLSNIVAISCGVSHSAAIKGDGTVVAWGDNAAGERNVPADLTNAVAISAGHNFNLAIRSDGSVRGFGGNVGNQLIPPADLTNAVQVVAAGYWPSIYSLALTADGRIVSWGSEAPSAPNVGNIVAISANLFSVQCTALDSNGTLIFWGHCGTWCTVPADLARVLSITAGAEVNTVLD